MRVDTGRLRVVAHDTAEAAALAESLPEDDALLETSARDDDLPSPGAYIEAQRLRRGMSIEQLAVVTKIPARSIALLEADRFEELPGQVFVKGFLRCCSRALGVSQQAVMDLLYERERASLVARRKDRSTDRAPERTAERGAARPAPAEPAPSKKRTRSTSAATSAATPEPLGGPRLPPRLDARATVGPASRPTAGDRVRDLIPSAHALLWIVVAIFVAFLVLAAFNLAGAPVGASQS